MKISGYVLEDVVEKLKKDFSEGLEELKKLGKKYPADKEVNELIPAK